MITIEQQDTLIAAGEQLSQSHWVIGFTTYEIIEGSEASRDSIFREIGILCGLSARRIEKIFYVYSAFMNHNLTKYPFGYYERAYEMGEHKYEAIEYLDFYVDEYGELPSISKFSFVYRSQILNEIVTDDRTPPEPDTAVFQYIGSIRSIMSYQLHNERVMQLLDELEAEIVLLSPIPAPTLQV